jgi:hypothetical protein
VDKRTRIVFWVSVAFFALQSLKFAKLGWSAAGCLSLSMVIIAAIAIIIAYRERRIALHLSSAALIIQNFDLTIAASIAISIVSLVVLGLALVYTPMRILIPRVDERCNPKLPNEHAN